MDLSHLTAAEIRALLQQIPEEIKKRKQARAGEAVQELRSIAKSMGYSLEELIALEQQKSKKPRNKKIQDATPPVSSLTV